MLLHDVSTALLPQLLHIPLGVLPIIIDGLASQSLFDGVLGTLGLILILYLYLQLIPGIFELAFSVDVFVLAHFLQYRPCLVISGHHSVELFFRAKVKGGVVGSPDRHGVLPVLQHVLVAEDLTNVQDRYWECLGFRLLLDGEIFVAGGALSASSTTLVLWVYRFGPCLLKPQHTLDLRLIILGILSPQHVGSVDFKISVGHNIDDFGFVALLVDHLVSLECFHVEGLYRLAELGLGLVVQKWQTFEKFHLFLELLGFYPFQEVVVILLLQLYHRTLAGSLHHDIFRSISEKGFLSKRLPRLQLASFDKPRPLVVSFNRPQVSPLGAAQLHILEHLQGQWLLGVIVNFDQLFGS